TKFTLIELGGQHIDSGLHVNLNGNESQFNANVAYICKDKQYLDMNHTVYHYGRKSICDMQVHGTIKDDATKVYRGTLDFKNGCRGANGNEFEETLILSPTTMNKSFPIILCDEDDIQGEHGSTIGKLSSDLLFYMQTRGICKEAAEKIMARARVQAVMDTIPDEETKALINSYLDKNEEE
ncbi:MAG: SufD family Fe-S cluster assembly protein, partial [Treponema sp.]|nr:SufD family Fe-S cluster assembly protein [Treponema sp.]